MKKGHLYFHQGWTDIVCQLALVNYYRQSYDDLNVVIRSDAKDLFDFYIRGLTGVNPRYVQMDNGRQINSQPFIDMEGRDQLFHGHIDMSRPDQFNNAFNNYCNGGRYTIFIEGFYVAYGIPYETRVSHFSIQRDEALENKVFDEFVLKHGDRYVLVHDDQNNHLNGPYSVNTKIDIDTPFPQVNLNRASSVFFDFIKVIQNAREVHLVDSVWAAICYHLDARYGLFLGIPINLYPKRGHTLMFTQPKTLNNWIIK